MGDIHPVCVDKPAPPPPPMYCGGICSGCAMKGKVHQDQDCLEKLQNRADSGLGSSLVGAAGREEESAGVSCVRT